jgi:hypothetical protein
VINQVAIVGNDGTRNKEFESFRIPISPWNTKSIFRRAPHIIPIFQRLLYNPKREAKWPTIQQAQILEMKIH